MSEKPTASETKRVRVSRKLVLLVLFVLMLAAYGGAYLGYRINHVLIHRAGNYHFTDIRGIRRDTNHYIDIGQVADGPELFDLAMLGASATSGDALAPEALESILKPALEEISRKERRRERLLAFFAPLVALETLYWKWTDPNPTQFYRWKSHE